MSECIGFADVDRDLVLTVTKKYIDEFEAKVEATREQLIQDQMTKRWFPAKTREQAIARLTNDDGIIAPWYRAGYQGSYWKNMAQELFDLASISSGPTIKVSTEATWLFKV